MTLPNQIYAHIQYWKLWVTLYFITVLSALSVLLHGSPVFTPVGGPGKTTANSDSLKPAQRAILPDSLILYNSDDSRLFFERDSVLGPDSLRHANDTLHSLSNLGKMFKADSSARLVADSTLKADTLNKVDTVKLADDSEIKDPINYKADDSIIYDMNSKRMYLFNKADVQYQKIKLNSDSVLFDWTTFTLYANGAPDSSGQMAGFPVFSESGKEYKAKRMAYNFKTKKGKVYEVTTKEGEAYVHSAEVKKNEYDEWYGHSSEYTTCDLDHPHFYFKAKKVKIVPDKVMVTGPANLWVGDVPTPLYVPFGIFPVKQGQRSGLILPEYGQDAILGFFLRNGGYYWAVNDYLGIKLTEQVSTNGTFGFNMASQYALRYKFTGNLSFSFLRSKPQDPDLPSSKATNSYSISWSHNQDARSLPNSTFGASVQMQSADFYQVSRVTDQRLLNTSFNSSINFSHTFGSSPFSMMVNVRHDQNLLNRTIDFTLPTFRISMSRVAPFKSKIKSDKPKWYEGIGITYGFEFQNRLSTYDSILFQSSSLNRFSFGINQTVGIDAPIKIFKYFTLTPSFQYQERTYFRGTNETWDPDTVYHFSDYGAVDTINGRIQRDTVWRFNSARNFSASISFGTKVTGIFKFKGKYLKAIKHVFTPSISGNYHPDFGDPLWKYYRTVQSSATGEVMKYSVFDPSAIYGIPGIGKEGSLTWNLNNNLEMKVYSKTDSVNHEKKVGLLDQVNLSGGYNFAADSLRLLPFNLTIVSARLFNLINLQFNAVFDPYAKNQFNNDINTFEWVKNRRLLRFSQANVSASFSLHSKQKPALTTPQEAPPKFMGDYVSYNPDQIYNFDIPWNLSASYHFNITHGTYNNPDTIVTLQTLSMQLDFNLTPHWKIALSTGFDISRKQVTLTNLTVVRDLHCWELSFAWTPALPTFPSQQFSIILHPKSATLKDLKLQKKNSLAPL